MNWKRFTVLFAILVFVGVGGMAMSATYSDFTSGNKKLAKSGIEPTQNYLPFIEYRKFDFGDTNFHNGTGVTHGDVIRMFNVEPNSFIEEFGYRVTTASLKSGTSAEVGDGADIDGFVGNDYTKLGVPFIDLSTTSNGVTRWNLIGPYTSGATDFVLSGVSVTIALEPATSGSSVASIASTTIVSNHGPYFTSGLSPYVGKDTVDMTIYVDKSFNPGLGKTGVTPVFEAYIKGFKRVVP